MADRAQSSTVGVVLLTAVVVVSVGVGGAVVLDRVATDAGPEGGSLLVDATVELTPSTITVTHAGGDSVSLSALSVLARSNGTTER